MCLFSASKLYSGVGFIPLERKGCSKVERQSFAAKSGTTLTSLLLLPASSKFMLKYIESVEFK